MLNKIHISIILILIWRSYLIQAIESVDELCRDMSIGYRIPHPETCNVYLECRNNNDEIHAMMFNCENDVNFNPTTLKCDSNYINEKCKKNNKNNSSTRKQDLTATTTIIEEPTKVISTMLPTEGSTIIVSTPVISTTTKDPKIIICPSQDSEQVLFIKSPIDCTKYFMCYHGNPLPFQCWLGFYWNDKMKKCTPPEIAECNANNYPYPECPPFGHYFLPHPEKCQYFLYCQNGIRMVQQCGSFDYWDINDRKCKKKARAICYSNFKNKKN